MAAGLVLRLYAGGDLFLHTWDERYHALVAKHLLAHPLVPTLYDHPVLPYDYRNWRANHVWLHKPPLALWMMAAGMRLLGVDEIAMRVPSLALSTAAIFLTFVIGSCLLGRRIGLLAAAFHAVNGYLLQLPAGRVAVDHVDNAVVFFVELGVFLAVLQARGGMPPPQWQPQPAGPGASPPAGPGAPLASGPGAPPAASRARDWWTWLSWSPAIGLATGLALLSKWLPGLLAVPVWLALAWGRRRPRQIAAGLAAILAVTAAVALPWQLYVRRTFPLEASWESFYNLRHLVVPIEGLGGSPLFHLMKMPRFFGELIYLPVAWLLVELLRRRPWRRDLLPLAVWIVVPYAAFSLAATKLGGYVMVAAPALFIVEAGFWVWLWDGGRTPAASGAPPTPRRPGRAAATLRWAVLVLLPLLPLRYTVERMKIRPTYDRNPPWARALRALPARLGPGPVVLFHLDRPLEAMFYTPYIAYEGLPTASQASRLREAGYRVVVLDAGTAPSWLRNVPGIELRSEAIPPSPLDDGTGFRPLRADGSDSPLAGTAETEPPP